MRIEVTKVTKDMEGIYAIIASNAYGAVNQYFRLIVSEGMHSLKKLKLKNYY
jgi:hypothetical protein